MSYQVVGEKAKNPDWQNRCWGAVMAMARDIIAAPQDSRAIEDAVTPIANDLTSEACKNQAKKFAKLSHLSTDRTIANLVLLNPTIAANPDAATDSDLQYQVKQVWMTLVEIG